MDREIGKDVLTVDRVSKTVDGVKVLNDISFTVAKGDKIAFIGDNEIAQTTLMQILAEELEPDEGSIKWGVSTSRSYFPKDNSEYFNGCDLSILQWLSQYSTSPKPTCAAFWAECFSPATMFISRYRCCREEKRFVVCFPE